MATCGSGGDAVFQWDLSACCAAPWSLLRQGDPSDLGKAQPWTNSQEFPALTLSQLPRNAHLLDLATFFELTNPLHRAALLGAFHRTPSAYLCLLPEPPTGSGDGSAVVLTRMPYLPLISVYS